MTAPAPARRAQTDPRIPKHVKHCFGTGCRDWWIYTWRRDAPEARRRQPYFCNSWRCPHCARHEAAVTFARIKEACDPLEPSGFVFVVLTLDREGYYSGERWSCVDDAYRAFSTMTRKFLKRLRRWQKREGMQPLKNQWVGVVEAHRTGWPHLNLLIHSPELAEHVASSQADVPACGFCARCRKGKSCRAPMLLQGAIRSAATGAGWGVQSTIERARSADAVGGYLTKLSATQGATAGELAKLTQAPTMAPVRFRRLRSGVGFLPPRRHDPDVTGTLVRRTRDSDGSFVVLPLHDPGSSASREQVAACCYDEDRIASEEARAEVQGLFEAAALAGERLMVAPAVGTVGLEPPRARLVPRLPEQPRRRRRPGGRRKPRAPPAGETDP